MITTILDFIRQPWPWYVSGLVIAAIMAFLLFWGKTFGFSSNLRSLCTLCGAGRRLPFFNINIQEQKWNLLFLAGAIIGGFIAGTFLTGKEPLSLSPATTADLQHLHISFDGKINPDQLFGVKSLFSLRGLLLLAGGGFLVGFGSRYAGGCTSGHAISGLSNLQKPSLIAVIGFFIGGLIMTHLLFPLIF